MIYAYRWFCETFLRIPAPTCLRPLVSKDDAMRWDGVCCKREGHLGKHLTVEGKTWQ